MGLFFYFCRALSQPERWESGLIHQFAKLAYPVRVPGVRIPPSPPYMHTPRFPPGVFHCTELRERIVFTRLAGSHVPGLLQGHDYSGYSCAKAF